MTEQISNHKNDQQYLSVREKVRKFNMLGTMNSISSEPIKLKSYTCSTSTISSTSQYGSSPHEIEEQKKFSNEITIIPHVSSTTINRHRPSASFIDDENEEVESMTIYASPATVQIQSKENDSDDIGLEIIEPVETQKQTINKDEVHDSLKCVPSIIEDYEANDIQEQQGELYPSAPPPRPPPPPPPISPLPDLQQESNYQPKRSLPLSNFLMEIGALVVVFILCMVLVLAIRESEANLRITMQFVYTYIYLVSIIWMIWCISDIMKFRREWIKLTSSAHDQEEYMDMVERYPHNISYFLDIHNTGGLFMRVGAGLLCMGSLLLTVVELAKTIETMRTGPKTREVLLSTYSPAIFVSKSITYICRFFFHCIQFTFLFRYGNIIIDRHHLIAKIGLIHLIIANFCTWFEAIVIETLEELHKHQGSKISTDISITFDTTTKAIISPRSGATTTISSIINFLKVMSAAEPISDTSKNSTTSVLEFIEKMESSIGVYLYPFLIEYSLISVTVFYIMWRNIGKTENRSFLHFGDRHLFTINCARASHGLLIGGIVFLLTIFSLIPYYIVTTSSAVVITHITELILFFIALLIVCISFFYTTKLYYDRQAHVDIFDQILILVTTIGNFADSFFALCASIFVEPYTIKIPRVVEITISLLAILQTFLQSAFILDTLKRRSITKSEIRKKPGRELITALLLINLAIWMHDSLSAKKVTLNPLQVEYYDVGTWSIVQAFTSPLSIFYRFHSSVCLADIWHEVYHDHGKHGRLHRLPIMNNIRNHPH